MMSLYETAPMPQPEKQIRLLKLESKTSEHDFSYSLSTYDPVEDCPSYVAISYTWYVWVNLLQSYTRESGVVEPEQLCLFVSRSAFSRHAQDVLVTHPSRTILT